MPGKCLPNLGKAWAGAACQISGRGLRAVWQICRISGHFLPSFGHVFANFWTGIAEDLGKDWLGPEKVSARTWEGIGQDLRRDWLGSGKGSARTGDGIGQDLGKDWLGSAKGLVRVLEGMCQDLQRNWPRAGRGLARDRKGISRDAIKMPHACRQQRSLAPDELGDDLPARLGQSLPKSWPSAPQILGRAWKKLTEFCEKVEKSLRDKVQKVILYATN